MMIRLFDVFFSAIGLIILAPVIFIIILLGLIDTGSPFFYQKRVGIYKNFFLLIKFRTMRLKTKQVGTHLVEKTLITTLGKFLRITKLDEITDVPQTPEPFNPIVENAGMQTFNDTQQANTSDPTEVDDSNLDIYRKSFTNTIRGHWRVMGLNEVKELFNQANYPFSHEIKRHPQNSNQIEIIIASSGNEKRIPSDDKNDWITVNG